MGNTESHGIIGEVLSDTSLIQDDLPSSLHLLPPIKQFHAKGKAYGAVLDFKLKGTYPNEWSYASIYDLRTGNKSP